MKGIRSGMNRREGWGLLAFTEDELHEIHLATLEILQECGVAVLSEAALDVFEGGGAWVDRVSNRVKIPAHMVEDALRSAPSRILMAARDPAKDVVLQAGRVCFTNFGVGVGINDLYTGEHRDTTLADVAASALLCDALEHIDVVAPAVDARDLPEDVVKELRLAETVLENTTKHIVHGEITSAEGVRKLVEIGAAVAGTKQKLRERPIFSTGSCPTSPLELGKSLCEIVIECARAGLPTVVLSMPMAGATAPVTLAGSLVTYNAEMLSTLVLHQLVERGAPFVYSASASSMDMKCGTCSVGSPEAAMLNAGVAELARYYLLPNWAAGG